jgi:hypothetical protein
VKPGGSLAIEVVNKYKFDPVLDSSNPWVGVSPQNYVKERLKTSKAVFDKFEYEATFELDDPKAEFRETFRFKDGSVRRQKHRMTMPNSNGSGSLENFLVQLREGAARRRTRPIEMRNQVDSEEEDGIVANEPP